MSGLEPTQMGDLRRAIVADGFDAELLERACSVFPREVLHVQIYWKQSLDQVVHELLNRLDERGPEAIVKFLRAAIFVNSYCPKLRAFCEQYFKGALEPLDPGLVIKVANLGLQVLIDQKNEPAFRETLGVFRARFSDTSTQIRVLKAYKGLHNILHDLQIEVLGIEPAVAAAQPGAATLRNLANRRLTPMAQDARAQAATLRHPGRAIEWIEDFESCIEDMNKAGVPGATLDDLRKVVDVPNRMKSIVSQEAPNINNLLVAAADVLQLQNLAQTMKLIATKIGQQAAPDDPVYRQLIGSSAVIGGLQTRLTALVDQHNVWQTLNTSLDEAELSLRHQPKDRIPKWGRFKKGLDELCDRYADEPWSTSIKALLSTWIDATPTAEPDSNEKRVGDIAFNNFHEACVKRFVEVDKALNKLSDTIIELATPLDALLCRI